MLEPYNMVSFVTKSGDFSLEGGAVSRPFQGMNRQDERSEQTFLYLSWSPGYGR